MKDGFWVKYYSGQLCYIVYVQSSKMKLVLVPGTEEAIVMLVTSLFWRLKLMLN